MRCYIYSPQEVTPPHVLLDLTTLLDNMNYFVVNNHTFQKGSDCRRGAIGSPVAHTLKATNRA